MKDVKMCMMIRGAADRLWLMKIWCMQWKRKFKRTDDSPFCHFPCIFHKFHRHFFMILCLEWTISTRKIMCTVFWYRKGVLLVEFLPQGSTINAGIYCDTLMKGHHAIQNKRHGMLSWGVMMLHDNARPHTATATQDLITTFGWEQFNHSPYSPDLAPSDFHVFLHLTTFLAGRRFHNNNNKVKEAVNTWLASQAASFYDAGIQKLVPHYDKCLNNGGNYV
jgi:histone-lysine N-methyltransferase SETMAR